MRIPIELRQAFRLINHGPTTLITSAHDGAANVMAAAWVMPLDFSPPKLGAVIDGKTHTRALIERSGELVVQLPTVTQSPLTWTVGSQSGRDLDKMVALGIETEPASLVGAPLIRGCAAWLECRVVPEPDLQARYDLFVVEVLAAWADDALWQNGEWQFPTLERSTIHHLTRGVFYATGPRVEGVKLA